jgi:hypothetical protein
VVETRRQREDCHAAWDGKAVGRGSQTKEGQRKRGRGRGRGLTS